MKHFDRLTSEQIWVVLSLYIVFAFMLFPFVGGLIYYLVFLAVGFGHMFLTFDPTFASNLSFWRRMRLWLIVYIPGGLVHLAILVKMLLR